MELSDVREEQAMELNAVHLCSYASKMYTRVFHISQYKKNYNPNTREWFLNSILYSHKFECTHGIKTDFIETLNEAVFLVMAI